MKRIFGALCAAAAIAGPAAAQDLERGEYIVRTIGGCGNCHTPQGPDGPVQGMELTGQMVEDTAAFTAYAPNITPAGRIASWSDDELKKAIREGVRPDGTLIGPPMPFEVYKGISDQDLDAIVAFLRTVPAVESDVPSSVYNIPLPPAYGPPISTVGHPDESDQLAWGAYNATSLGHCVSCHSPLTPQGPDIGENAFRGGAEFHGPWGVSVSKNLTPSEDGIAKWTDDELKQMITTGVRPGGERMNPPMGYGYYANMKDSDLDAIIAYLRSLPPKPDVE